MLLAKKPVLASDLGVTFPKGRDNMRETNPSLDESLVFVEIPITFIFSSEHDNHQPITKPFEPKSVYGGTPTIIQTSHPKRLVVELEEDLTFIEKQVSSFNISENHPLASSLVQSQFDALPKKPAVPRPEALENSPGPALRSRQGRTKSGRAEPTTVSRDLGKQPCVTAYQSGVKNKMEGLKSHLAHTRFDFAAVTKADISPSRRLRLGASGDSIMAGSSRVTHSAPKNSSFETDTKRKVSAKRNPPTYHMQMSLREGGMPGRRSSGRLGLSGGNLAAPLKGNGGTVSLLKGLRGETSRSSSKPLGTKTGNRPSSRGLDPQNAAVVAACSLLGTGLTQATVIARRSVNKKAFLDQLLEAFPKAPRDQTVGNLKRRIRQKCNPKIKTSTEDPSSATKYNSRSSRDPGESRSSLARLTVKKSDDNGFSYPLSLGLKKWELRSEKFHGLSSLGFSSLQSETEYPRTSTNSDFASKAALTRCSLLNLSAKLSQETNPSSIVCKKKILQTNKCQTPAGRSSKLTTKATTAESGHRSREIARTQPSSAHQNLSVAALSQHLKPSFSEKQKIMSYLSKNQEDIDLNYNTLMDWEKKKQSAQPVANQTSVPARRNLLQTTLLRSQGGISSGFDSHILHSSKKQSHTEGFF